jgi:hypothetical protein
MIRALVLSSALVVGACGGGSKRATQEPVENKAATTVAEAPPPPPSDGERVFARFAEFEKAMCACVDADCAKRVSDEMTRWSKAEATAQKEPLEMTEDEQKRAVEIGTHMGECMQTAMGM